MRAPRRSHFPIPHLLALLAVCCALVAGCGSDEFNASRATGNVLPFQFRQEVEGEWLALGMLGEAPFSKRITVTTMGTQQMTISMVFDPLLPEPPGESRTYLGTTGVQGIFQVFADSEEDRISGQMGFLLDSGFEDVLLIETYFVMPQVWGEQYPATPTWTSLFAIRGSGAPVADPSGSYVSYQVPYLTSNCSEGLLPPQTPLELSLAGGFLTATFPAWASGELFGSYLPIQAQLAGLLDVAGVSWTSDLQLLATSDTVLGIFVLTDPEECAVTAVLKADRVPPPAATSGVVLENPFVAEPLHFGWLSPTAPPGATIVPPAARLELELPAGPWTFLIRPESSPRPLPLSSELPEGAPIRLLPTWTAPPAGDTGLREAPVSPERP